MSNTFKLQYVGIDPGVSGGLVQLDSVGRLTVSKMPADEKALYDWLYSAIVTPYKLFDIRTICAIEQVTGYIAGKEDQKQSGQPASRMFTFGQSYGSLRMGLVACGLVDRGSIQGGSLAFGGISSDKTTGLFYSVPAKTWQKALGLKRSKGMTKEQWKRSLQHKAQCTFPTLAGKDGGLFDSGKRNDVTLAVSDALLITDYIRMMCAIG